MFRTHAKRDEARGDALQPWQRFDDARQQRNPERSVARLERGADDIILNQDLHSLRHSHRKFPAAPNRIELPFGRTAIGQPGRQ